MGNEKITFLVVTTGEDLEAEFNVDEPLEVVFQRALALVGGEAHRDQFTLDFKEEPLKDLGRPIREFAAELNWGRRVELELTPRPVVV